MSDCNDRICANCIRKRYNGREIKIIDIIEEACRELETKYPEADLSYDVDIEKGGIKSIKEGELHIYMDEFDQKKAHQITLEFTKMVNFRVCRNRSIGINRLFKELPYMDSINVIYT